MLEHLNPGKRLSGAVAAGGFLYISGQVADNENASFAEQVRQVLAKINDYLEQAGSNREKLVFVSVYLTNIMDFDAMNEIYEAWIDSSAAPARVTVEARLANPSLRVEMTAIAVV